MPRLKTQSTRDNLLRRMRKQRLKYITILPSLITILNGVCGFTAIVFASKGVVLGLERFSCFSIAGYLILLAMIADMLDGRIARKVKSTSSFGGQLDSLCDIISFGVAPAFLMLKVLEYKLAGLDGLNPIFLNFLQRFIWLAAAAYISCAAIRLARFNVENEEDESAHMSFVGMPTPAAAGVIVSLVIFHQEILQQLPAEGMRVQLNYGDGILCVLPFFVLGLSLLMVSRIRYSHILNQYLKGKKPFAYLMRALLFLGLIIWSRQAALVLIFCCFAASGLVRWFYYKVLKRNYLRLSTKQGALKSS